jgi:hypothetical protein
VVEAASELLLHRYFGSAYDARDVTEFVRELREATDDDGTFSQLKTEAVIHSTLGTDCAPNAQIRKGEKFQIHLAAMGLANGKLGIDEAEIDRVIAEAEHIAFAKGWHPPLAAH